MPVKINFNIECNTDAETIKHNLNKSENYKAARVVYGPVLSKPPVAVVGGGPSAADSLVILRQWPGDIYAINDTAKYLSDQGIEHYLYSIDCSRFCYNIGPLTKGALLATRCHRKQFTMFDKKDVRTFDLAEDFRGGVGGGPTGVCRSPLLFLRMGHIQVHYFGCDGSFLAPTETHVSGTQGIAHENMIIVRAGKFEYLTNASLLVQSEYMAKIFNKHSQYLINNSAGLLLSMIQNPDDWEVRAVAEDLRDQLERRGTNPFTKDYGPQECQPQAQ